MKYTSYFEEYKKYYNSLKDNSNIVSLATSLSDDGTNNLNSIKHTYFDVLKNSKWKENGKSIVNSIVMGYEDKIIKINNIIKEKLLKVCTLSINDLLPKLIEMKTKDEELKNTIADYNMNVELLNMYNIKFQNEPTTTEEFSGYLKGKKQYQTIPNPEKERLRNLVETYSRRVDNLKDKIKELENELKNLQNEVNKIINNINNLDGNVSLNNTNADISTTIPKVIGYEYQDIKYDGCRYSVYVPIFEDEKYKPTILLQLPGSSQMQSGALSQLESMLGGGIEKDSNKDGVIYNSERKSENYYTSPYIVITVHEYSDNPTQKFKEFVDKIKTDYNIPSNEKTMLFGYSHGTTHASDYILKYGDTLSSVYLGGTSPRAYEKLGMDETIDVIRTNNFPVTIISGEGDENAMGANNKNFDKFMDEIQNLENNPYTFEEVTNSDKQSFMVTTKKGYGKLRENTYGSHGGNNEQYIITKYLDFTPSNDDMISKVTWNNNTNK